nr:hypothetical protein [Tanacetum cinerariifolium]
MNRGEPPDDLSKIRGEILNSDDPFTLPRTVTWGADTPAWIIGDSYKNGGEVNSTRRHSGRDVDPSGRDNHSGPGRGSKFRPFTVVLPIERIMKETIRMVLESIYDPEFPDTSHFCSGRGCHSALRRIKEEWGTSRWFLEFDIRKCFHTIDRHRLIPIFKEKIGDPKFFYPIQKVFSAGRLIGAEKGHYSVPHSVLLSALTENIYLHKLDQEIGRILQKSKLQHSPRQQSHHYGEGKEHPMQSSLSFPCFVVAHPSHKHPGSGGDQKRSFVFPPSSALVAFLNKPSSLLCAAFLIEATGLTPKAEFYGRECCNNNWAMRDFFKYCKRKGLLIELGGEAILVIRINNNSCTEYGRIPRYGHSGSPSEEDSHTILARAGEASMSKAPYTYNCLPPTLRHPFQV